MFGLDPYEAAIGNFAYFGPGAAAVVEQAKSSKPTPKASAWLNPEDKGKVLEESLGKTIIWDFDGVVADTEPVQWDSFRLVLLEYGFVPKDNFHVELMGHTEPDIWELLFQQGAPRDDIKKLIDKRSELYIELAKRILPPSWLSHELMHLFADTAKVQYVISNGNPVNNSALLNHWKMDHLAEVVIRGEKTKAELFTQHATSTPSLILEDNEKYAQIAKQGGAYVVGVIHSLSPTQLLLPADVTVHI